METGIRWVLVQRHVSGWVLEEVQERRDPNEPWTSVEYEVSGSTTPQNVESLFRRIERVRNPNENVLPALLEIAKLRPDLAADYVIRRGIEIAPKPYAETEKLYDVVRRSHRVALAIELTRTLGDACPEFRAEIFKRFCT